MAVTRTDLWIGHPYRVSDLVVRISEGLDTTVEKVISDAGYLRLRAVVMENLGSEGDTTG